MNPIKSLSAAIFCTALSVIMAPAIDAKPNIILFFVDDLGQNDLSYYGSDFHETPHMDTLAKQGMSFKNAYSAYPRCVPSRQGLLSGKYPCRLDQNQSTHALPASEVTFGEALKKHGYKTAYMGKWHLGKEGGGPSTQGFDVTVHTGAPGAPKNYFYPFTMEHGSSIEGKLEGKEGDYLTDRLTDEAVKFIESNKENPFLLVLAHYAVHTPFQAPEKSIRHFREKLKKMNRPEGGKGGMGKSGDQDIVIDRKSQTKTLQNNPVYAAMLKHTDDSLGRVITAVEKAGITNNTIIILTSDHGGLSSRGLENGRPLATTNAPYRQGKGSIFEGGTRVPMIVKWPGKVKAASTTPVQITGTDHFPTMLAMAGAPLMPEQHIDGRSYLKALEGEVYQRDGMFWYKWMARPDSTGDTQALSYIEGNYKVIEWWSEGKVELYDLSQDLSEQKDLSQAKPELTQKMLTKLRAKEKEIGVLRKKGTRALKRRLEKKKAKRKNKK